jgi:hypothetical protein
VCVAISWYLQREHDLYPASLTTSHQAPDQRWIPTERKKLWINNEMRTTRPFFYDKTINWKLLEQYGRIRTLLTIDLPQTTKTLLSFENQLNMLESFPTTFYSYSKKTNSMLTFHCGVGSPVNSELHWQLRCQQHVHRHSSLLATNPSGSTNWNHISRNKIRPWK